MDGEERKATPIPRGMTRDTTFGQKTAKKSHQDKLRSAREQKVKMAAKAKAEKEQEGLEGRGEGEAGQAPREEGSRESSPTAPGSPGGGGGDAQQEKLIIRIKFGRTRELPTHPVAPSGLTLPFSP